MEKKDQAHAVEVAEKVNALKKCEATRILDQEVIERLEAKCNEMRCQRSSAKEKLCEMEAKLSEAEEKNMQLVTQTNDALIKKVNWCQRGFVLWQIETQKWLELRDLERRATAMIVCSVSGQRQLAMKLDAFLTSSCEAMANLELKLTDILRRLGLDQKSDSTATADSAGGMLVWSSH